MNKTKNRKTEGEIEIGEIENRQRDETTKRQNDRRQKGRQVGGTCRDVQMCMRDGYAVDFLVLAQPFSVFFLKVIGFSTEACFESSA